MNLLHLSQILNYGSAYGILSFMRELRTAHYSQLIFLSQERSWLKHSKEFLQILFELGIPIRMVESTFFRNPWCLENLRRLIRFYKQSLPGIYLSHGGFSALASSMEGVPFLHICHGFGMNRPSWVDDQDLKGIRAAVRVVAVSEDIRRQLIGLGIEPNKISVAYYPIRPIQKNPPKSGPIKEIGMIGNLVPLKGQNLGIDSFRLLVGKEKGLRLHIYGDGPLRQALESQVRKYSLSTKVLFHGFKKMSQEYPKLDLVLVPSLVEGLGMVNLESFEYSLPVCAFATGGIPEIVQDQKSGYLAPKGDIEELSHCMAKAVENPDEARKMARRGLQNAIELFDPKKNLAVLNSGLEEVLRHHKDIKIR